jgi:hypothetical protein
VASPAVAGRLRNTGNRERVGTAPIGAALVEDIYLVDGACLLPVGDPRPVQLSVPLDVGGRRANLVVTCRIEPVPSTAREVLSLIAEPPSAGRAPPPAPAGEALIPGAVTGAGIGLAVAITTGVVVGTSVGGLLGKDLPANGRAPVVLAAASAGLYTALLSGLFALPLGVVVGGGIGYGIDEQNRPVVEAARRHRALQAAHDAWEAARKEAGLDVDTATDGAPSTRPSDPPLDAPLDPQGEPQGDPSSSHPRS